MSENQTSLSKVGFTGSGNWEVQGGAGRSAPRHSIGTQMISLAFSPFFLSTNRSFHVMGKVASDSCKLSFLLFMTQKTFPLPVSLH